MYMHIENNIYLGDHNAPNEIKTDAILAVMNDRVPYEVKVPYYMRIPMPDGNGIDENMIYQAFKFLDFCLYDNEPGLPTLIHCWSGRSRSVAILAGWFHRISEAPFDDVLKKILTMRLEREDVWEFKVPLDEYPFPSPKVLEMVRKYLNAGVTLKESEVRTYV